MRFAPEVKGSRAQGGMMSEDAMSNSPAKSRPNSSPPRVVAVSGMIFSALYITNLVLVRLAMPADPKDPGIWLADPAYRNWVAQFCGHSLALSHARSGDVAVISGYLGKSDVFDEAIAAFSVAYADQNEKDHAVLNRAIQDGKIEALIEEPK
jgi:hypothetical protein